jgi:hypothetical protein
VTPRRPEVGTTLRLVQPDERIAVLRSKVEAAVRDLDQLGRDSMDSQDFDLVAGLGEASHALHRALLTLEDRVGSGGCTSAG